LQGFASVDGKKRPILWAFEKPRGNVFSTQPANLAVENGFYPDDVETYLADVIENPSNRILEHIRDLHRFEEADKVEFSRYITAMIRRVPRHRERLYNEVLPDALGKTFESWRELIQSEHSAGHLSGDTLALRMRELDELERRWKLEPPDELKPENTPPNVSPEVVELLSSMHWTFVTSEGPSFFLTSDNPVFFTEGRGMGKPDSELSFPLSTHVALWIKRIPVASDCAFCRAKQFLVREMNKRTIVCATRFLYYHEHAQWIPRLITHPHPKLQQLPDGDTGVFKDRPRS